MRTRAQMLGGVQLFQTYTDCPLCGRCRSAGEQNPHNACLPGASSGENENKPRLPLATLCCLCAIRASHLKTTLSRLPCHLDLLTGSSRTRLGGKRKGAALLLPDSHGSSRGRESSNGKGGSTVTGVSSGAATSGSPLSAVHFRQPTAGSPLVMGPRRHLQR